MKIIFASILLVLALAGCAVTITPEQLASADFGPKPTPDQVEKMANEWFELHLKDPSSAQKKFGEIKKVALRRGSIRYGWAQWMEVNAKNSYGGYTGYKRYVLFIEGGKVHSDIWYEFDGRAITNAQIIP